MHIAKEYADAGRLTAFVGAGASALPPSSLPTWLDVNVAVLAALAGEVRGPHAPPIEALVRGRLAAGRLPPEYQAEVVAQRFRHSYFDVLACLDGDAPNAVHRALAALAAAGRLRAIVTTNFDRLIELAFARAGVPLVVRIHDADYAARRLVPPDTRGPCELLKLHGSAEAPASLVDTLAQRKRGLALDKLDVLRTLHRESHWLFLGCSGADLDADPNYLSLSSGSTGGMPDRTVGRDRHGCLSRMCATQSVNDEPDVEGDHCACPTRTRSWMPDRKAAI